MPWHWATIQDPTTYSCPVPCALPWYVELALRLKELDVWEEIGSMAEFFVCLDTLTWAVTEVIDEVVPKTRLSPYQKW